MSITNTALFVCLDDFAKTYEDWERHRLIPSGRQRLRSGKLTLGESLFIMVLFHLSPFKDFKRNSQAPCPIGLRGFVPSEPCDDLRW